MSFIVIKLGYTVFHTREFRNSIMKSPLKLTSVMIIQIKIPINATIYM